MFKKIIRKSITYIYSFLLTKKKVRISLIAYISLKTYFAGGNVINSFSNVINSHIGYGTYLGENCEMPNTYIGSYCSIANNVKIIPYTHTSSIFVSTHPSFFSILKQSGFTYVSEQFFEEELFYDKERGLNAKIGNDVWIGTNVKIIGGIEIGDGAILAAGSIITKNVPPYAIVAGIPAKIIRYRFNENQISYLLETKWWEKDPKWIKNNSHLFIDIEKFILEMNDLSD